MKIKVNGIRVNKTTGCLGNSVPCPTHSSLAFTLVQSLESNNTLLTEGHNRQQCSIFKLCLSKRDLLLEDTYSKWKKEKHKEGQDRRQNSRESGFKNAPHLQHHNHYSDIHPRPALLSHASLSDGCVTKGQRDDKTNLLCLVCIVLYNISRTIHTIYVR